MVYINGTKSEVERESTETQTEGHFNSTGAVQGADMRLPISAFFLLSLLFSICSPSEARKDPEEYWRSMMNGQPMPKAIGDLTINDRDHHFMRDFDTGTTHIIYRSRTAKPLQTESAQAQQSSAEVAKEIPH
ncbi:hypothetical protein NMG60_11019593 [Bertholletia excelsa]